MSDVGQNQN